MKSGKMKEITMKAGNVITNALSQVLCLLDLSFSVMGFGTLALSLYFAVFSCWDLGGHQTCNKAKIYGKTCNEAKFNYFH